MMTGVQQRNGAAASEPIQPPDGQWQPRRARRCRRTDARKRKGRRLAGPRSSSRKPSVRVDPNAVAMDVRGGEFIVAAIALPGCCSGRIEPAQTDCSQGLAESAVPVQIPLVFLFAGAPSHGRPGPVIHPGKDDRTLITSGSGSTANSGRRTNIPREALPDQGPIDVKRSGSTKDPSHRQCRGRSLIGMASWKLRVSTTDRSVCEGCLTIRLGHRSITGNRSAKPGFARVIAWPPDRI
jgi:hypothetical protein